MRVISGTAKGITLKAVPGMRTRPTSDKVKEAMFSIIGPYFDGGIALDLFAGTGGLGIEALSRGLDKAIFVDADKTCVGVIRNNLRAAGFLERAEVYRNDAFRALKALAKRQIRFRLVFLDPPYRLRIIEELTESLQKLGLVEEGSVIVAEHDAAYACADRIGAAECKKRAEYGDTALSIYRVHRTEQQEEMRS